MINQSALNELKTFIGTRADDLRAQGLTMLLTNKSYNSFKAMRRDFLASDKVITISTEGNEGTMYGEATNLAFRFWHDATHLRLDEGFSLEGELAVIKEHMKEAFDAGLSDTAMDMLRADTLGQVKYYFEHKEFVSNQSLFVENCLYHGIASTVKAGS